MASTPRRSKISSGVGVVLISPEKHVIPRAYSLIEPFSNNVAEYNALLIGLSFAKELGVEYLEGFGDSQLIINQVRREYEVKNQDMIPYHKAAIEVAKSFEDFFIEYIPCLQNAYAYALAILAVSIAQPPEIEQVVTVRTHQLFIPECTLDTDEVHATRIKLEPRDWHFLIIDYVLHGIFPEDMKERDSVRQRALRFYYNAVTQTLYRHTYYSLLLRCLSTKEAEEALKEGHGGTDGAYHPRPKLCDRLSRMGYY
ncbi:uncharacterized protein LOC109838999 [Asparagus officinalis]|uniref:uncharacterized protein LOC109838999 n=1 Tax=Asparagus officinalis TaxID=4686 RepID=UPI00098E68BF|nr:uncharacterized protein LOC109838999 [Asparagus officinalis]